VVAVAAGVTGGLILTAERSGGRGQERKWHSEWPRDVDAFTLQIASRRSLHGAQAVAGDARRQGLSAHVLRSGEYPGLTPGYFVVYSGSYGTSTAAQADLGRAQAVRGDAFVRWVSPAGHPAPTARAQGSSQAQTTGGSGSAGSDERSTGDPSAHTARAYHASSYDLEVPGNWQLVERERSHSGQFKQTEWRVPGAPETKFLVDYTEGYEGTPEEGARGVRAQRRSQPGYREIEFGPTVLNGFDAWRWTYLLADAKQVDFFVQACGTGYAMLGSSPPATFERYGSLFEEVAQSFSTTC
jgi:SPOR domain